MNPGILAAITAYASWGLLPVYWKLLIHVPTTQLLAHRIVWSFVSLILFLALTRRLKALGRNLNLTAWRASALVGLLIGANWFIYVWSVNAGYIVEASLGYFINPLFSVLLGVFFLRERLQRLQWFAMGLATAGVLYLTFQYGRLPWIALSLGATFSIYGLAKKKISLGTFEGLTLETGILFLPALGWLLFCEQHDLAVFLHGDICTNLLLPGAGLITTAPLLLFAIAAKRIPLSMIGILQYIAPTLQLLLGIFLYKESFSAAQLIGFILIWSAVLLFWLEGWRANHAARRTV